MEYWVGFPVLYCRSLLASHSMYFSAHAPMPNPQSSPPPKAAPFHVFFTLFKAGARDWAVGWLAHAKESCKIFRS